MVLGSGIRKKPIPDPGARGQKAPDPGSATLEKKICHKKWRCWLVHLKSFDLNTETFFSSLHPLNRARLQVISDYQMMRRTHRKN
jgi:hypothetical protein